MTARISQDTAWVGIVWSTVGENALINAEEPSDRLESPDFLSEISSEIGVVLTRCREACILTQPLRVLRVRH